MYDLCYDVSNSYFVFNKYIPKSSKWIIVYFNLEEFKCGIRGKNVIKVNKI